MVPRVRVELTHTQCFQRVPYRLATPTKSCALPTELPGQNYGGKPRYRPEHLGVADHCLTSWLVYHWCRKRDLNPHATITSPQFLRLRCLPIPTFRQMKKDERTRLEPVAELESATSSLQVRCTTYCATLAYCGRVLIGSTRNPTSTSEASHPSPPMLFILPYQRSRPCRTKCRAICVQMTRSSHSRP